MILACKKKLGKTNINKWEYGKYSHIIPFFFLKTSLTACSSSHSELIFICLIFVFCICDLSDVNLYFVFVWHLYFVFASSPYSVWWWHTIAHPATVNRLPRYVWPVDHLDSLVCMYSMLRYSNTKQYLTKYKYKN